MGGLGRQPRPNRLEIGRPPGAPGPRGPVTGKPKPRKYKSGAQKRAAKRDADVLAAVAPLQATPSKPAAAVAPPAPPADEDDTDTGVNARFAALGPPPADIELALPWARRHVALALHLVATNPTPAVIARARLIKELADSVGRTHDRGELERRLGALERKRAERSGPAGGLETFDAGSIARPPTARGTRRGGSE